MPPSNPGGYVIVKQTNSGNLILNYLFLDVNGVFGNTMGNIQLYYILPCWVKGVNTKLICRNGVLHNCMSHIVSFQISQINYIRVIYRSILMQHCGVCWFTSLITLTDIFSRGKLEAIALCCMATKWLMEKSSQWRCLGLAVVNIFFCLRCASWYGHYRKMLFMVSYY